MQSVCEQLMILYGQYSNEINFVKDVVYFIGFYKIIMYIISKKFKDSCAEINENLQFREKIEPELVKFIEEYEYTKDVCIRFIHWKNYPKNLLNDGFKFKLRINYSNDNKSWYGWIDNMGINFEEPLSMFGNSVYLDKNYIFFIAEKNQKYKNFREINCEFILHLPFKNIINFDFKGKIEYEPVFYTRYNYNNWKKLYDDIIVLSNKSKENFLYLELSQDRMIKKYSKLNYLFLKIKLKLKMFFDECFSRVRF